MRLIDKDAILHDLENGVYPASMTYTLAVDIAKGLIEVASEIDAVPVVRGEWREIRNPYGELEGWIHEECGRGTDEASHYCPECGAIMTLCCARRFEPKCSSNHMKGEQG